MTPNHHENNGTDRSSAEDLAVLATARALDRLTHEEEEVLNAALSKPANVELVRAVDAANRVAPIMMEALASRELPKPSVELRAALEAELDSSVVSPAEKLTATPKRTRWLEAIIGLSLAGVLLSLLFPAVETHRTTARNAKNDLKDWLPSANQPPKDGQPTSPMQLVTPRITVDEAEGFEGHQESVAKTEPSVTREAINEFQAASGSGAAPSATARPTLSFSVTGQPTNKELPDTSGQNHAAGVDNNANGYYPRPGMGAGMSGGGMGGSGMRGGGMGVGGPGAAKPLAPGMPGMSNGAMSGMSGMPGAGMEGKPNSMPGGGPQGMAGMPGVGPPTTWSQPTPYFLAEGARQYESDYLSVTDVQRAKGLEQEIDRRLSVAKQNHFGDLSGPGNESYAAIVENEFRIVRDQPLSTFSIDVDTASYANVRRFLSQGQLPPKDAIRVEELLNYFSYDYPQPQENDPFSVNMEVAECPWRSENRLLRVGLKGREVPREKRVASNLVFLIDVSGSMQPENKLPLIKTALKLLVKELTEDDRVSIVTYAGDAGLRLPSTNGTEQGRIVDVIESLSAGGSTHGSAGIALAYEQATSYFIQGGTNRVILLTDGDLNVGITDDDALVQLIQQKAKSGVFLTVLGVGDGNLKDSKMEKMADHGNGVYAYLDGVREARKVLVEQMSGSLITIAKDVKLQIEFNPAQVQAYRLIGYENRVLANRDFHDDTKDAGEIGAGHTVTALYELVPANMPIPPQGEPLKYQPARVPETPVAPTPENTSRELLTLKLRFKRPDADQSVLRDYPLSDHGGKFGQASVDFRFASSVAMFGLVLRDSQFRGSATLAAVEEIASSSLGEDRRGYRSEFVDLVRKAEQLK